MKVKRVDGIVFRDMLENGYRYLKSKEEEINNLNVFPVADGDTGSNMCFTLRHGLDRAGRNENLGAYLKKLSDGMLMGARGNSGVILSQLFYGFYAALARHQDSTAAEMRNALIRGYRTAYEAVLAPVEGTILTVAREGIEHIKNQIGRSTDVNSFLAIYIAEMKRTLAATPDMLEVLKKSGVVDSGAVGYIAIFEGMYKYLAGEIIEGEITEAKEKETSKATVHFNENSEFSDGYCTEFMLQLMKGGKYSQNFKLDLFINTLKKLGTSIVAVQNGTRVKVHVHTFEPEKVIAIARRFGEFISFKLENMQLQHNEHTSKMEAEKEETKERVPIETICVSNGDGVSELLSQLGCGHVIYAGDSMNASAEEFVNEINKTNAEKVLIFPNNKNTIMAARQAVTLSGKDNVEVLSSTGVTDSYFALAMDIQDSDDAQRRVACIKAGLEDASSVCVTTAEKTCVENGVSVTAGEYIALISDKTVYSSGNLIESAMAGLEKIDDIDDKECCIMLVGNNADRNLVDELTDEMTRRYPLMSVECVDGGQNVYDVIIGIS